MALILLPVAVEQPFQPLSSTLKTKIDLRACVRPNSRKVKGQRAVKLEADTYSLEKCR
ncbi:hypothetical protein H6G03_30635 [Planktothrix sp. FACHB-1375]|uniref:Uncharacterized protein n=1 Tax=Aerosakkonema funiforme FACHB-1375 TaxID=2949571 RepID=A0A926VKA8_9CYAN|nr:hypothetical protein [Aerosakkonema funiforme FACHB-1375]